MVFNPETKTKQLVYSVSVTTDPTECSLMLAESAMARPRGAYGTPARSDYDARLGMIQPRSHTESTVVMPAVVLYAAPPIERPDRVRGTARGPARGCSSTDRVRGTAQSPARERGYSDHSTRHISGSC